MPWSHHSQTEYHHHLAPKFWGKSCMSYEHDGTRLKHRYAGCLPRLDDLGTHWSSKNQVSLKIWILGSIAFYFQKEYLKLFEGLDLSSAQGQAF